MLDLFRPRPRFYQRPWFLATLTLLAIFLLAGFLWLWVQKGQWEAKAKSFDYTRLEDMESASIIYDRAGNVLGRIFIQNRDQVPFEQISPNLITAVVAAEDARFYTHHG